MANPPSLMASLSVDDRYALRDILRRKLQNIPADTLPPFKPPPGPSPSSRKRVSTEDDDESKFLTTTNVVNHEANAVNLPHIPPDLRLDFLLKHRAMIDAHSRLAIKDAEKQHINITRAIYFWRFDDLHQFQRYHDSARWNIAIFVALLTDRTHDEPKSEIGKATCDNPKSAKAKAAREFVVAYLAAVLEHHNDAATFEKREAFIKLWKSTKYDLFTFNSAQKQTMKRDMKRLSNEWQAELERIQKAKDLGNNEYEVETAYNAKVAKFVGVLIPGPRSQRGLHYRAPAETIEGLKMQSGISANNMQRGVLLEALKMNESDYYVPKPQPKIKPKVTTGPPEVPNTTILGFAVQDVEFLEGQKPKPESQTTDWPALHFPKISPPDLEERKAAEVVDVREAIWVLKKSKTREMLAKLMELFPEDIPVRKPPYVGATLSDLPLLPAATDRPASVIPPTFEDLGAFVVNNVPKSLMDSVAHSDSVANMSSSSKDNQQTKLGKRSISEQDEALEEPEKKRSKVEQDTVARSLMLPVDGSLLQLETTWQISADPPAATSTTSLFGRDEQKSRSSLFRGSN
ncbi:hypothetical protein P171DRAFT_501974 [Karstenula rhodostoma CBS 690.94]|uniref:Uncharacterized protein n=1 Tax=Karstenula rhodostoma CBS 690.94 TaxID=1392251 RepID=A0A9P4U701_9PLEO|nr:hypothetical protein P171DRAFT_501974 [Karstenula rhodostoma CBS 690.94]